jgi:hypothetical protein
VSNNLYIVPSESSDYSDWTADAGLSLQPPKRRSARQVKRRHFSSEETEEDEDEEDSEKVGECSIFAKIYDT